jgi:Domain of unknown function (DUF4129)
MTGARRGVTVGLAAATFGLAALAASADPVPLAVEGSGGWFVEPLDSDDGAGADSSEGDETSSEEAREVQSAASAVLELIALAAVAIFTVLLGRAMLRRFQGTEARPERQPPPVRPGAPTPEMADAVEEGLATLESGPVDDAIVACWVRLEKAAAGGGVARLPSETATELTVRLLGRFDVPERAVARLLQLYRTARYSRHHLGEDDRAAAVASLQAIGVAMDRATT